MKTAIFILCIMLSFSVKSQENSIYHKKNRSKLENYLSKMNQLMSGKCVIETKKKRLVATFYQGGEKIRTDILYVEAMDPEGVSFKADEHAVIARCKKNLSGRMAKFNEGCIQRTIHVTGAVRQYHRINFIVKDNDMAEVEEFENHLRELIKDAQLMDHQY